MTSLSKAPLEQPRQVECCFLFLEDLTGYETLAWHLIEDNKGVECVILPTLTRLDNIPFGAALPLLTYNQARDALITQAITALNREHDGRHDGPMLVERLSLCELLELSRLAFLVERVLRSSETEVAKFFDVSAFRVPELVQYTIDRLGQSLPSSMGAECCYDA